MQEHPMIKWVGVSVSIVGLLVSAVIYLESVRSGIHENRVLLAEVQQTQAAHFAQREDRFEELEVGQRDIKGAMTTSLDDLSYRLGVHAGRHESKE